MGTGCNRTDGYGGSLTELWRIGKTAMFARLSTLSGGMAVLLTHSQLSVIDRLSCRFHWRQLPGRRCKALGGGGVLP